MSSERIEQVRSSIDRTLETLQSRAEALRAHFGLTKQKRAERIEHSKQALRETLDKLRAEIRRRQGLASETRQKLGAAIDDLKVQISLGKAEGADLLEAERKRVSTGLHHFENRVDQLLAKSRPKIDVAAETLMQEYAQARDALNTELEAATARLKEEASRSGAAFEERKKQLTEKIGRVQQQLAGHRKRFGEKLSQFEREAKPGLDQISKALKQLFS